MSNSLLKGVGTWLSGQLPGVEIVSLKSRTSTDPQTGFTTSTGLRARRRRQTKDELMRPDMLGGSRDLLGARRTEIWELYQDNLTANNAPNPKVGDQIVDSTGQTYTIVQPVGYQLLEQIFACQTQLNVP